MNLLLGLIAVLSTVFAVYEFNEYSKHTSESQGFTHMVLCIVGIIVACICAFVYFYKRTKAEADQDISITKF